jgi:hypothetical protein
MTAESRAGVPAAGWRLKLGAVLIFVAPALPAAARVKPGILVPR